VDGRTSKGSFLVLVAVVTADLGIRWELVIRSMMEFGLVSEVMRDVNIVLCDIEGVTWSVDPK
jgi:hypothetical protein